MSLELRCLQTCLTLALCVFAPVTHGAELNDPTLRFSLTVPDEFAPDSQITGSNPDFQHAFRRPSSAEGELDTVIIVERMRGTIGRERLSRSRLPAGFKGELFTLKWRGFDVDAVEIRETVEANETVTYNAQVPLKGEAIQLRVIGPAQSSVELRALAQRLLDGLRGESNWLASSAPRSVAASPHYGAVMVAVIVLFIVTGLAVLWLLRRRLPRGGVLALAVVIYATSWLVGPGVTREGRATVGAVRLLGFAGGLLGLYDLIRRPTAQPKTD